jgi:hypothetical protein
MVNKKEVKRLQKFAKQILKKSILKKIKEVKDLEWKEETIKYSIKSALENKYDLLLKKEKKLEHQGKDVFFVSTKIHSLKYKINLFIATYHKKDFDNILKGFEDVGKEIKILEKNKNV